MLKVQGLRKSFATPQGEAHVINGVDFSVPEGHCYVLLGPSGCGKTTTLRCVAGLEQADAGVIEIAGTVVSDPARGIFVPVHERPIGMVFQSYAIWPHLDVFENVAYPLRVQRPRVGKGEMEARVTEVLTMVGMEAFASRPAARLSGGQQQRVALARALVRKPALLLLDEPLSNLDARLRDTMRNELSDLIARAGVTALFVTHDQAEAFALADRVAVMHQGVIAQEGVPRDIYARPASPFIAGFLGAANLLAGSVHADSDDSGNDRARRVLLHGGTQSLLLATAHAPGARVDIVIRPEDVNLLAGPTDVPAGNLLQGTVVDIHYLGGQIECAVDLGGARLSVLAHPSRALELGQQVWLHIDAARCTVFARAA